ncbi:MAG: hypothetical protein K2Y29_06075 [Beijerinckiaceae bacterium]|nr:hypothetical protein [Beijerinckiaceae bacterium]
MTGDADPDDGAGVTCAMTDVASTAVAAVAAVAAAIVVIMKSRRSIIGVPLIISSNLPVYMFKALLGALPVEKKSPREFSREASRTAINADILLVSRHTS